MRHRVLHILFLCTGNSARSIMAEALVNTLAPARFRAYSAGSHPKGTVHPYALEALQHVQVPIAGLRSKSWEEFTRPGAPPIDVVLTLCDDAANETCPLWPASPITAHWGLPDPAAVEGAEEDKRGAFGDTLHTLQRYVDRLLHLPLAALDRGSLQQRLMAIGTRIWNEA